MFTEVVDGADSRDTSVLLSQYPINNVSNIALTNAPRVSVKSVDNNKVAAEVRTHRPAVRRLKNKQKCVLRAVYCSHNTSHSPSYWCKPLLQHHASPRGAYTVSRKIASTWRGDTGRDSSREDLLYVHAFMTSIAAWLIHICCPSKGLVMNENLIVSWRIALLRSGLATEADKIHLVEPPLFSTTSQLPGITETRKFLPSQ